MKPLILPEPVDGFEAELVCVERQKPNLCGCAREKASGTESAKVF